jgi:hypothetical protein
MELYEYSRHILHLSGRKQDIQVNYTHIYNNNPILDVILNTRTQYTQSHLT